MKKERIKLLSIITALCMIFSMVSVMAEEEVNNKCGENLTWTLDNAGTLTISGTGEMDVMGKLNHSQVSRHMK